MTSKANSPPSYEEALHHPKAEDCSYQPPPSYSPSTGMYPGPPGYWSQGGVFPQTSESPGLSPTVTTIPTLSAAVPAAHTGQGFRPRTLSTSRFVLWWLGCLPRWHGGVLQKPVGEHVCAARLHQKGMGSEHPPLKRESCAEVLRLLTGLLDPGGAARLHLHSGCRVHVCVSGPHRLAVLLMWWRERSATCLCLPPQWPSEAVCHQIPRHLLGISVSPSKQQRERLHAGGVTSMLFSVHSAVYFVVYCVLICLKEPRWAWFRSEQSDGSVCTHFQIWYLWFRRRFPWNLLLLGIFVSMDQYVLTVQCIGNDLLHPNRLLPYPTWLEPSQGLFSNSGNASTPWEPRPVRHFLYFCVQLLWDQSGVHCHGDYSGRLCGSDSLLLPNQGRWRWRFVRGCLCWRCKRTPLSRITIGHWLPLNI